MPATAMSEKSKKLNDQEKDILPVISLVCGCGGLDLGFRKTGFQPVIAIDKDASACKTYQQKHPGVRVLKQDLASAPRVYILHRLAELPQARYPAWMIGGPTCQAFSLSNP